MKLTRRIAEDNITLEWEYGDAPEYVDYSFAQNANWYEVTLKMDGRELTVPFGMGVLLEREPEVDDVMSCLILDASSVEDIEGFYQWAHEFGYDPDAEFGRTRRIYDAVVKSAENLREFLGEKYHDYLYNTENDV